MTSVPSGDENAFLGALVGLAIGDALGLPLEGTTAEEIGRDYANLTTYVPLAESAEPEGQPDKGVISDKTEIALCLVESLTTNEGELDPENINARLHFLMEGPSRQWMSNAVAQGIETAFETDGVVDERDGPTESSIAVRGVVVGLMHAIGEPDDDALVADARTAARLTHGDAESARASTFVARATAQAARHVDGPGDWDVVWPEGFADADDLAGIVQTVKAAETFEAAVLATVKAGGPTSSRGAIAGGIAGARFGAAGLPQSLIDDLDARIYLSMAAPWFYRTIMRKAGEFIDLRMIENEFPG